MSKLPEGWEEKQLKNIVDKDRKITYGIVQPGGDISPNGIPLIRGKDYSSGQINLTGLYHVSEAIDKPYKRSKVKENDILLTIVGYVGQTAIVPKELENANITQTTARISVNPTIADYKYIDYFLNSFLGQKNLKKYEKGSAQAGLNLKDIEKVKIYLAPLSEQKKIAEILSTVDQKIAFVDNKIEEAELLKKGLMQKLLTEGIGHTEFKDSELGRIPVECEVLKIEKIISSEKNSIKVGPFGSQIKKEDLLENGPYRIYGQENVIRNDFSIGKRFLSEEKYQSLKSNTIQENDIVITTMGTGEQCKVVPKNIEVGIMDSHLIRIRCNLNKAFPEFIAKLIHESYVIKKQIKRLSQGAIMSGLSAKIIKSLVFPIPSVHEQKQIVKILSTADEKLDNLKAKKESFEELKKGLMQKLLTGEVRI